MRIIPIKSMISTELRNIRHLSYTQRERGTRLACAIAKILQLAIEMLFASRWGQLPRNVIL